MIFILKDIDSDTNIRNEYVKANSTFKMTGLPPGTYKMMEISGNDFSYDIKSPCGSKGYFTKNVYCSKSEKQDDLLEVVNNSSGYSTGTIYLQPRINGNLESQPATESEIFF